MECHRSRLLDPTAVGSARGLLTHCLGRPTGWEKSWSYGPAACSEFHFFTDEQEDSAQVTSDLIAAGNTKVLQDRCIVFFYYIQTINTLTSESRTRNPLTFNSFLPLVCCLKISGARDPPTMASMTSEQTVRGTGHPRQLPYPSLSEPASDHIFVFTPRRISTKRLKVVEP